MNIKLVNNSNPQQNVAYSSSDVIGRVGSTNSQHIAPGTSSNDNKSLYTDINKSVDMQGYKNTHVSTKDNTKGIGIEKQITQGRGDTKSTGNVGFQSGSLNIGGMNNNMQFETSGKNTNEPLSFRGDNNNAIGRNNIHTNNTQHVQVNSGNMLNNNEAYQSGNLNVNNTKETANPSFGDGFGRPGGRDDLANRATTDTFMENAASSRRSNLKQSGTRSELTSNYQEQQNKADGDKTLMSKPTIMQANQAKANLQKVNTKGFNSQSFDEDDMRSLNKLENAMMNETHYFDDSDNSFIYQDNPHYFGKSFYVNPNWDLNKSNMSKIDESIQATIDNYLYRGNLSYMKGKVPEAVDYYNKIIELEPNYQNVYINKGNALCDLNKFDEALHCYDKAISIDDSLIALNNKAIVLYNQKQYDQAIDLYNRAIQIDPFYVNAYNNLGNVYKHLNRYDEAITMYDKAIFKNPEYFYAHFNKGLTLELKKNFTQAIECFNSVLKLNPKFTEAYNNKGACYFKTNDFKAAIQCFDEALIHLVDDPKILFNKAVTWEKHGNQRMALDTYDKILQSNPHHADSLINKGNIFKSLKKYKDAESCYFKVINNVQNNFLAFNNLGNVLMDQKQHQEALKNFDRAITINAKNAILFYNRANCYDEMNKYEEAIQDYNKALTISPNYLQALNNKGNTYKTQNNRKEAIKCFEQILRIDPKNQTAGLNLELLNSDV
jgi:tetratricopeptide (TPR) repeat protein